MVVTQPSAPVVLIVDDSEDTRELYTDYLRFHGFTVLEASSGTDAVEKVRALTPSVVVMDLSMPGMDGWEATQRVKALPGASSVWVIAMTGHSEEVHELAARAAGCDDFVIKPCLPADLLARIRAHLAVLDSAPSGG